MSKKIKNARDVERWLKEKELPSNFCIVPFVNMILGPGGDISVCREKGSKHTVGSLKESSLEDVWNNSYMKKWRNEFLNGNPIICRDEIKYKRCNQFPEHYWDLDDEKYEEKREFPFKKLTANLNGECNLRCTMCDVWQQENGYYQEENFWKEAAKKIFPYIKEVELLSGEPLIQEDTFKLMDEVLKVNKGVQWSITTNGIWDYYGRIENYLSKIHIKKFIFSLDSLDEERYRKIRINGDLKVLISNIERLRELRELRKKEFDILIHFLLMKKNRDELFKILNFVKINGLKLTIDVCEFPGKDSLLTLGVEEKVEWLESFLLDELEWEEIKPIGKSLIRVANTLPESKKKEYIMKLFLKRQGIY